jgi:hypothetical protein
MRVVLRNYTTDGDDVEESTLPEGYEWEEEEGGWYVAIESLEQLHSLLNELEHPVAVETEFDDEPSLVITLDPAAD